MKKKHWIMGKKAINAKFKKIARPIIVLQNLKEQSSNNVEKILSRRVNSGEILYFEKNMFKVYSPKME